MSTIKSIILDTPIQELENIISPFITEQFPTFMKSDHPKLILFIKAYYEWLESPGNAGYVSSKLASVGDVDNNLTEFYDHFKNIYTESFPEVLAINAEGYTPNKTTLLKKIREFYGNKGTENAYRFLFRVLYNSDLEIYSPKEDILRISSGVWVEPKSVKTTCLSGDDIYNSLRGKLIQYSDTDLDLVIASATIDNIVRYSAHGIPVTEFFLTDIIGVFLPDADVIARSATTDYTEKTYSVLGDFYIDTPGTGYVVGDNLFIVADGVGFVAKVSVIGLAGTIKKISIQDSGINYYSEVSAMVISSSGVNTASRIILTPTAITNYPGYFYGNKGKISSNKKIQDGNYYQDYSYVLQSHVSFDKYFTVLKSIIHPAGMKMFGEILLNANLLVTSTADAWRKTFASPFIGSYAPYRIDSSLNLRANGQTTTGYTASTDSLTWAGLSGATTSGRLDLLQTSGTVAGAWGSGGATSVEGYTGDFRLEFNLDLGSNILVGLRGITTPVAAPLAGVCYAWLMNPNNTIQVQEGIGNQTAVAAVTGASYSIQRTGNTLRYFKAGAEAYTHGVPAGQTLYATVSMFSSGSTAYNLKFYGFQRIASTAGDLYPIGYNPYISSSSFAVRGLTSPVGTVYNSYLGITYATVPESGTIVHNPLGIPLGSSGSWEAGNESGQEIGNNINRIPGLTLWLKPENIGVCGAMINGASMDVWRDASASLNHAIPPKWDRWTSAVSLQGVTIDKLRPTLIINDNGIVGATGIAFNSGVLNSPYTVSNPDGRTLGALGITFGPGNTGDKLNTAQHFYLTKGLTLTTEMDLFVVFRAREGNTASNFGFINSNRYASDSFFSTSDDVIVSCKGWNNSGYVSGPRYAYDTAAFLFRPYGGYSLGTVASAQRGIIGYNPFVSGVGAGIIIGQASRDDTSNLYAWYSGEVATNSSPNTGYSIAREDLAAVTTICGVTVDIGRFGGYVKPEFTSINIVNTAAWIAGATANPGYGFTGVINEVIVYNRKLTELERQMVYGYLSRKYKMDDILPATYESVHRSAKVIKAPFWTIKTHPTPGISFSGITLNDFFKSEILAVRSNPSPLATSGYDFTNQYTSDTVTAIIMASQGASASPGIDGPVGPFGLTLPPGSTAADPDNPCPDSISSYHGSNCTCYACLEWMTNHGGIGPDGLAHPGEFSPAFPAAGCDSLFPEGYALYWQRILYARMMRNLPPNPSSEDYATESRRGSQDQDPNNTSRGKECYIFRQNPWDCRWSATVRIDGPAPPCCYHERTPIVLEVLPNTAID